MMMRLITYDLKHLPAYDPFVLETLGASDSLAQLTI